PVVEFDQEIADRDSHAPAQTDHLFLRKADGLMRAGTNECIDGGDQALVALRDELRGTEKGDDLAPLIGLKRTPGALLSSEGNLLRQCLERRSCVAEAGIVVRWDLPERVRGLFK